METVVMVQVQKYGSTTSAAFDGLSPYDLKTQAAMVMAKINRLPVEQRAVLWALHVQRDTEMIYLTTHLTSRFGYKTDLDIIRKWATGVGPGCRNLADRHGTSHMTLHRYEKAVVRDLERMMHQAYAALEEPLAGILQNLRYKATEVA